MELYIAFSDLHKSSDPVESFNQQKEFFSILDDDAIENLIICLGSELRAEHYPHEYEVFLSDSTLEQVEKGFGDNYHIVYSGDGSNERELLLAIFFVMGHMSGKDQVLFFLKKLAHEMYNLNREVARNIEGILNQIRP